jgi:hypothetical protein
MKASETDDGANEPLRTMVARDDARPAPEASPLAGIKAIAAILAIALAAGVASWGASNRFRVAEVVDEDDFYGGAEISVPLATRNGMVAYATIGAVLALGLGVTAGLLTRRRSAPRAALAGLAGAVLGACGGAATSWLLVPVFFRRMESANITLAVLIHLGIWMAVGAASGFAAGTGVGSRGGFARCLIGGIIGAALGTVLFDIPGAFFPFAHTERPLAEEAVTRLVGNLLLASGVAVGIVAIASQRSRAPARDA